MKYIFIRHGESSANRDAIISNLDDCHSLTGKGIQQSEALSERLVGERVIKIFSSPLLRAQETSRIISRRIGAPIILENALREFSCGTLEGRGDSDAWETFVSLFQRWLKGEDWNMPMCGGDSYLDILTRFKPFITKLIHQYQGDHSGSILLVSHGGILYTMLPDIIENIDFDYSSKYIISNTSMIVAEEKDGHLYCLEWCGELIGK